MPLRQSTVALRIFGDDLVPEEVSALMGCEPTRSYRKGQLRQAPSYLAKTGTWLLEAADAEPGDIEAQVVEVLGRVTHDAKVWQQLGERFELDIYCGAFMQTGNEGIELSPQTLLLLGQRGLALGVELYAPSQDDA
jgi:hypothetical protein